MRHSLLPLTRRAKWLAAAVLVAMVFMLVAGPAERASAVNFVPYQFIAKTYTEGIGRAPDQSGWAGRVSYFASQGCTTATVAAQANWILTSAEFNSLGYSNPALVEVAYRTLLNREPDSFGYNIFLGALNGGSSYISVLNSIEASSEFSSYASTVCSISDFGFGTAPAMSLSPDGTGYSGDQAGLQSLLNAATPGSTVYLMPRAVIPLTSTLTIPAGVTLATTGLPSVQRYAEMGRLARQPGWTGEAVAIQGGATLTHVWVDGDRPRESAFVPDRFNIRAYGGSGTTVSNNRIGNTAGNTNLEFKGALSGHPCANATIANNLIDAYSSKHGGGSLSDGISDGCEHSTVTGNTVIDASDVGIILFGGTASVAQQSQVTNNTVIQAGHGAFALLGVDPSTSEPLGATRSFDGSAMSSNLIWTSPAGTSTFGIANGTYAWFGGSAAIGTNSVVENNTAGSLAVYANTGIAISGMLTTLVTGNTLNWVSAQDPAGTTCPKWDIGASVSQGWASGIFPGYTDALYASCVCPCTP